MARQLVPPTETIAGSHLYELIGGSASCRRIAVAFYARVANDPVLRPLFPGKSFTCAIEAFAAFLAQFLGGPGEDAQRRWWLSLRESHQRFKIGVEERSAWMSNMVQALDDVAIAEPLRTEFLALFERSSAYLVNQGDPALRNDPSQNPQIHETSNHTHAEISRRWEGQLQLDDAVAAIGSGNADRAIAVAESSAFQICSRSAHGGLLALMIRSGHDALLTYVREKVTRDPALAHERLRYGRTLLQEAAAAGNLPMTELLLNLGADPNARDNSGHTPLYSLSNECVTEGGGNVVRALVSAGAGVNASDGVKHCTPLHMAARRGNVEIAGALLDSGGNIDARDSVGDTPLRRAVNCEKIGLVSLLLARGADVLSIGSKGATPVLAARSTAMKKLLQSAVESAAQR